MCEIFKDTVSGAKTERHGLNEVLKFLREGDTLVVWKLDRLGRSIRHLIEVLQSLSKRGISSVAFKKILIPRRVQVN